MAVHTRDLAPAGSSRRSARSAERRFYGSISLAILVAVLLGFSRTFFLRPWFQSWAHTHGAREPFFLFHGLVFSAWFALLVLQPLLIARRNLDLHRRLGWMGAGLALAMVVVGTLGALIAARRPTGFVDNPLPPLQFLVVPFVEIGFFGVFVGLAIAKRRQPQSHKRYMLLASISIVDAAVSRWPFAWISLRPVPAFGMNDLFVDCFLIAMVVWDLVSRRRVHPVTLWGSLVLVASQPLRFLLARTGLWLAFAGWAVGLLGS